jgi:hypothetical protein
MNERSKPIEVGGDRQRSDESERVLAQIAALIRHLRYGTIEIVVHDGRVVQIQRKERFRFPNDGSDPDRGSNER